MNPSLSHDRQHLAELLHLTLADIRRYLALVQAGGDAFLTPTAYQGRAAIRASITNWQTTTADIDLTWQALQSGWQKWQQSGGRQ